MGVDSFMMVLGDPQSLSCSGSQRGKCSGMKGEGLSLSRRGVDGVAVLEDLPVVVLDLT